jgi:hypothetical protein
MAVRWERPVTIGLPQTVETLDLELDRTDFTNVGRVAQAVNNAFGGTIASALDGRSVRLSLPPEYRQRPVEFIAAVEAVSVDMDAKAKVVVNERTGTVIIGSEGAGAEENQPTGTANEPVVEDAVPVSPLPIWSDNFTGRLATGSIYQRDEVSRRNRQRRPLGYSPSRSGGRPCD